MSARPRRGRSEAGFLAAVLLAVALARPVGEWLGEPPPVPSWEQCRIGLEQRRLLEEDGDRPLAIRVEGASAHLSGTMTEAISCKLRRLREAHPEVSLLVLGDINGTIDEDATMEAALMIRQWGIDTHAAPGADIASGGVTLFLGGAERSIGPRAVFGVHSWAYTGDGAEGRDLPPDHPEHAVYLDFYDRIGMEPAYYWFTLGAAGADDIHELTPEEIARYRFVTRSEPRAAVTR